MNVAVFGWYHHRNAGDDRMQECLTRWLDGHTLAFLPAGRPVPVDFLATYDAVVIGGGSLIHGDGGGMFRDMARWARAAGLPVALVGVGIEDITADLRRDLREFLDLCCFAWLRDAGSLEEIGEHPRAFVAPDLTWLYPHGLAEEPGRDDTAAVCLRLTGGLPIAGWAEALAGLEVEKRAWPLYFEGGGDAGVLRQVLPGSPVPDHFSMAPCREAGAAVSARFHGLLFALQVGRPCLAVSAQPKVLRFLAEHDLEPWAVAEDRPADLAEMWPRFTASRRELGRRALALRSSLEAEVWEKTEAARARLLEQAGELPPPSRRLGHRARRLFRFGNA